MTSSKRIAFLFALFALAIAPLWTAHVAAQSARAKEVGLHIKCMCKGCGMTEQQIIEAFVAQYGTIAYVEPPKHGFGLVAWVMPFVYFLMGLALVVFIVRKWAMRPGTASPAAVSAHNEALDRARAQAARETED